jgi:putative membrane protein
MSTEAQAVLQTWSSPTWTNVSLALTALVYARGWLSIRRFLPALIPIWRLAAFFSGLLALWIALGSPLSAFDDVSLTAHMVQHLLLMAVAPPLLLLGAPSIPFLRGLPQWFVRDVVGPFLRWYPVKWFGRFLTHLAVCWLVATLALLAWHIPAAFELALRSEGWHEVEHICFLSTSILFWWPAVLPFPSEATWSRWSIPVYLFFATLPGGVLGAFLIFCDRVVYPSYAVAPRLFGISSLEDQAIAGALMWVFGTFIYTIPAIIITVRLLSPRDAPAHKQRALGLPRIIA